MSKAMRLRRAQTESADVNSWKCKTCDRMIEGDDPCDVYCRYCASYWRDVDEGLWADPIDDEGARR